MKVVRENVNRIKHKVKSIEYNIKQQTAAAAAVAAIAAAAPRLAQPAVRQARPGRRCPGFSGRRCCNRYCFGCILLYVIIYLSFRFIYLISFVTFVTLALMVSFYLYQDGIRLVFGL